MDVVIPLKDNSSFTEIRYCLRGIDKHISNVDKIIIVGPDPGFLKNVLFKYMPDKYGVSDKEKNVFLKTLAACMDPEVSQNFLFMNDDHFMLQDADAENYPYYYKCDLQFSIGLFKKDAPYGKALKNTREALLKNEKTTFNFDIHTPIVYNKVKFTQAVNAYDWSVKNGYVIKSLYGNTVGVDPVHMVDLKLTMPRSYEGIKSRIAGRSVFSTGDFCMNENMIRVLNELYPDKSRWEK